LGAVAGVSGQLRVVWGVVAGSEGPLPGEEPQARALKASVLRRNL